MSDQESTPNDINNDDESRKRTFDEISSGNEDIPKHQQEPLGPAADTSLAQSCYDNDEESELRRTMAASYVENSDSTKADDAGDSEKPKAKRDEKRMEINRQRAKEIRKRKKKMVEDMQKQIIYLTLENNKFRTQTQMQQAEINLLRSTTHKNLGNTTAAPHHHQFDLLGQQQQQQHHNFNHNHNFHDPGTSRGAQSLSASLLAGLNSLPSAQQPSSNLLGDHASLSASLNGSQAAFPFSNLQNSALSGLHSASSNVNAVLGGVSNTAGANSLNFLNSGASFHHQQVANALASNQEQDALGMGTTSGQGMPIESPNNCGLQQEPQDGSNGQNQLSSVFANASSKVKKSLLQRLQSEHESEARILSMMIEQQKHNKNGSNNSNNGM